MGVKKMSGGFTIIELLIVVAIIGILSAIAVPNLINAMQRSKQKRTMSDMRNIAGAWEARHVDEHSYVAAGQSAAFEFPQTPMTGAEISAVLTPTYMRALPTNDGWGRAFEFYGDASSYVIRSAGKNGTFESVPASPTATSDFNCDIIYRNGAFYQYPEGTQALSST